jgi:hypothetical protein
MEFLAVVITMAGVMVIIELVREMRDELRDKHIKK